jgi:hypothetical protein
MARCRAAAAAAAELFFTLYHRLLPQQHHNLLPHRARQARECVLLPAARQLADVYRH